MAERIRFELTAADKTKRAFGGVNGGLAKMRRNAQKLSSTFRTVGRNMSLFVTAPIAALGVATARLADTQIQAERMLSTALALSGGAVKQRLAGFKAFAAGLQKITVVGDEVTLQNAQVAVSMGLTDNQAKSAAKNAIALSAAFGINAKSAIRYTAALEQGDTTMLNRYIPTLRQFKTATERTAEAQRILAGAFNVATEAAKSGLGPFRQMSNELSDLGEKFGKAILPTITAFSDKIRGVIKAIDALSPVQKKWLVGLAAALAVGGPIIVGAGLLVAAIGALLTPIGLVVGAVVGLGGVFGALALSVFGAKTETQSLKGVLDGMGVAAAATGNIDASAKAFGSLADQAIRARESIAALELDKNLAKFQSVVNAVTVSATNVFDYNIEQLRSTLAGIKKGNAIAAEYASGGFANATSAETIANTQAMLNVDVLRRQFDHVINAMNITSDAAKMLVADFDALDNAKGIEAQAVAMGNLRDGIISAFGGIGNLTEKQKEFVEQLSRGVLASKGLLPVVSAIAPAIVTSAEAAGTLTTALRGATGQAAALSTFLSSLPGALSGSAAKIAGLKAGIAALARGGDEAAASIAEYRAQLVASLPPLESMQDGQREFVRQSIEQKVAAHATEMSLGAQKAKMLESLAKKMVAVANGGGGNVVTFAPTNAGQKQIASLQAQIAALGMTSRATATLAAKTQLLADAQSRGVDLNRVIASSGLTVREMIDRQAQSIGALTEEYKSAQEQAQFFDGITKDLENGLIDAIVSGDSFADTLSNIAKQLEKAALQAVLFGEGPLNNLFGGASGLFGGLIDSASAGIASGSGSVTQLFPSANGNVFDGGNVIPFASGGIISGPTIFPMNNGTGVAGEAGPEAIMPLKRGADGKLGVHASGAAPAQVQNIQNVNVQFNVRDAESYRQSRGQIAADVASAAAHGRRLF